eukprot:m.357786 g.357786  ORF g.357786 m.357786 type:complete len:345 (+) comp17939_c0_seq1:98-1132(+)
MDDVIKAKPKVHLHLHLDGAVRDDTLYELGKAREFEWATKHPDAASFRKEFESTEQTTLADVLDAFYIRIIPVLEGNLTALERVAYELCEDQSKQGVVYAEARYSPYCFAKQGVSLDDVVHAIYSGFQRGKKAFGIHITTILCALKNQPENAVGVVELAKKHLATHEVVGVDVAGYESANPMSEFAEAFQLAKTYNIHRTAHAGEAGPAKNVKDAIELLGAERIGHGYHAVDDDAILTQALEANTHFECCLTSSLITGAQVGLEKHAVQVFKARGASFSLSTDDPAVFATTLLRDLLEQCPKASLNVNDIAKCQVQGAQAAFLEGELKAALVERITDAWKEYLA